MSVIRTDAPSTGKVLSTDLDINLQNLFKDVQQETVARQQRQLLTSLCNVFVRYWKWSLLCCMTVMQFSQRDCGLQREHLTMKPVRTIIWMQIQTRGLFQMDHLELKKPLIPTVLLHRFLFQCVHDELMIIWCWDAGNINNEQILLHSSCSSTGWGGYGVLSRRSESQQQQQQQKGLNCRNK